MISALKSIIKEKINTYRRRYDNQDISVYRLLRLVFSKKGASRIAKFLFKVMRFLFRVVFKVELKNDFELWLSKNQPTKKQLRAFKEESKILEYRPKVTVVMPVFNTPLDYLKEAVGSVKSQVYDNWQLSIVDDASTSEKVLDYLRSIDGDENVQVHFRKENGHISATTNDGIQNSVGDYIIFLDHDDKLAPECIFKFVEALQGENKPDFLYADEGKFNDNGRFDHPFFKPQWSPDSLESRNYILHPVFVKKTLLDEVGGLTIGLEGAQDYDLALRLSEKAKKIVRLPYVLYFWRMHENSTADLSAQGVKDYAFEAQRSALELAFERRGVDAWLETDNDWKGLFHPRYKFEGEPKVSIIIPAHNQAEVTELCLTTLFEKTGYQNFDVLVLSNNSTEPGFFEVLNAFSNKYPDRFNWVEQNYPFNYSKLMNAGFRMVNGELICHLNNDVEIIKEDWMERMIEQAMRKEIGAVGAKLLYPNKLVQHAGVVIGLHGCAGHAFVAAREEQGGPYFQLVANNNYAAVTGACLMVHRVKYEEVNGFDELQVVEYNDIDFCLRLLELGYRNLYLSKVELIHHESLSRGHPHKTKESYAVHVKDVSRFTRNWQSYMDDDPYYSPNLSRRHTHYLPKTNKYD